LAGGVPQPPTPWQPRTRSSQTYHTRATGWGRGRRRGPGSRRHLARLCSLVVVWRLRRALQVVWRFGRESELGCWPEGSVRHEALKARPFDRSRKARPWRQEGCGTRATSRTRGREPDTASGLAFLSCEPDPSGASPRLLAAHRGPTALFWRGHGLGRRSGGTHTFDSAGNPSAWQGMCALNLESGRLRPQDYTQGQGVCPPVSPYPRTSASA